MINRIRDIRRAKNLTLADVAARCVPATTPQTIGRLETGTRNLSLGWMNRIGAALEVDPQLLVRGDAVEQPRLIARLGNSGAEALSVPRDAILPTALGIEGRLVVVEVEVSMGEYRAGDQLWLRQSQSGNFSRQINRDVLASLPGGRLAFGRLIEQNGKRISLLPLGSGQPQIVVENPEWLATTEMLVRHL